ncbi:hypothetical protein D3C81_1697890 [compost metagenome]
MHQAQQALAIPAFTALLAGVLAQGGVGASQAGAAQERQRRGHVLLALVAVVDLHVPVGGDDDGLVRFVEGQHVQDVAVGIAQRVGRARQLQLPVEHTLAMAFLRGQAQVLDARAHLVFVAIGGVVMDRESHAASR